MKRSSIVASAGALVVLAVAGTYVFGAGRGKDRLDEPPALPAAALASSPGIDFLGVSIGSSRLAEVQALTASWGLTCSDRGVQVLARDFLERRKAAPIRRAGADATVDSVSRSPRAHPSAGEESPELRWSCPAAPSEKLRDRAREPSQGRLLFVFDDAGGVVRHASFQRSHASWPEAARDYTSSQAALRARFGEGKETGVPSEQQPLEKHARLRTEWTLAGVATSVVVSNIGNGGFAVTEQLDAMRKSRPVIPAD